MGKFKVAQLLTEDDQAQFPMDMGAKDLNDEQVIAELTADGRQAADVAEYILSTTGLGKVDMLSGENKEVKQCITSLVEAIVEEIGKLDPRFEGEVIQAGSVSEGTKTGYPDEFDFSVRLKRIESLVTGMTLVANPGYAKIALTDSAREEMAEFITVDGFLSAQVLSCLFHRLLKRALCDVMSRQSHLQPRVQLYMMHTFEVQNDVNPYVSTSKLQNLYLLWRGAEYKFLLISLDVFPVISVNMWPTNAITSTPLLPGKLTDANVLLFPKGPKGENNAGGYTYSTFERWVATDICKNSDPGIWRISFSQQEMQIFNHPHLSPMLKDAFSLIKALRSTHPVNAIAPMPTYGLKQVMLHEVEKLFKEGEEVRGDDTQLLLKVVYRGCMTWCKSVKSEQLVGFFVRDHQLYEMDRDHLGHVFQSVMCESILHILRATGFGED